MLGDTAVDGDAVADALLLFVALELVAPFEVTVEGVVGETGVFVLVDRLAMPAVSPSTPDALLDAVTGALNPAAGVDEAPAALVVFLSGLKVFVDS